MTRGRLAAAAMVATAFLAGLGVAGWRDRCTPDRPVAVASATLPPAATADHAATATPSTVARTPDGARGAALDYAAAATRWLYLTDAQLRAAVLAITTVDAGPALTERTVAEIRVAREALRHTSGRVWWLVRPLAWRLDSYADIEARVSVWTVSMLSATGVAAPQSDWRTVAVTLRWENDGWRVAAISDRPGPTPTVGGRDVPWQPEPFDAALRGFHRLGAETTR